MYCEATHQQDRPPEGERGGNEAMTEKPKGPFSPEILVKLVARADSSEEIRTRFNN